MKYLIVPLLFITMYIIGAICHEADLARNFNKTGNAKAWFFTIKTGNK